MHVFLILLYALTGRTNFKNELQVQKVRVFQSLSPCYNFPELCTVNSAEVNSYCDTGHIWIDRSSKHCWLAQEFPVGWRVLYVECKELYILLRIVVWSLVCAESFCPSLCGTALALWCLPKCRHPHQDVLRTKAFAWVYFLEVTDGLWNVRIRGVFLFCFVI